jgi:hypothetical protein
MSDSLIEGLLATGCVDHVAEQVYEPEIEAFGGPMAMNVAHRSYTTRQDVTMAALGTTTTAVGASLLRARVQARSDTGTWFASGVQRLGVRGGCCAPTTRLTVG